MGMIEDLNQQIKDSNAVFIERGIEPTFGWDTAVGYLTHCADVSLGEPVDILTYRLPLANDIDSIRPVMEYLNNNLDSKILGADLYVSLTTRKQSSYTSANTIIVWNVLGNGEITYNDSTLMMIPGDLFVIPKNNKYMIKSTTAQAWCLFSLE